MDVVLWRAKCFLTFGRINYSYKDRYLFEANLRADASSRVSIRTTVGMVPFFSAGWRISEESFMKPIAWLNNLKLRAFVWYAG